MDGTVITDRSVAAVVAGLILTGCAGPGPQADSPVGDSRPVVWTLDDNLTVERIAPGVWVHTTWVTLGGGARLPSNGLLVRDGDGLMLIDTAWGDASTARLLTWIDANLERPVRRVIVTHFHDDRYGGASVLRERNIPIQTHAMTARLTRDETAFDPADVFRLDVGQALTIGSVEVYYPGAAHTRDNTVVWVPSAGVLFGGCAVRPAGSRTLGNIADADVAAWSASIRRVADRYPLASAVVPSHGPPGDLTLLSHTLSLLAAESR